MDRRLPPLAADSYPEPPGELTLRFTAVHPLYSRFKRGATVPLAFALAQPRGPYQADFQLHFGTAGENTCRGKRPVKAGEFYLAVTSWKSPHKDRDLAVGTYEGLTAFLNAGGYFENRDGRVILAIDEVGKVGEVVRGRLLIEGQQLGASGYFTALLCPPREPWGSRSGQLNR